MNCEKCGKELKRNDFIRAICTGWYHDQYESIAGIEVYDILRIGHTDCNNPKKYPEGGGLNGD